MASQQHIFPTVIVHGGAGYIPSEEKDGPDEWYQGVKMAVKAGYKALCGDSGSALDAVEAAVCVLEDLPVFNAGRLILNSLHSQVWRKLCTMPRSISVP